MCPAEDAAQPTTTPPEAQELSSPTPPQPVLLSPSRFLRSSGSGGETLSLRDPPTLLGLSQLVSVTSVTNAGAEGGMAQILLEDGQTIPVQIVDPASIGKYMATQRKETKRFFFFFNKLVSMFNQLES